MRSITEGAVKIWETRGHHVEEASPPLDPPYATWEEIASAQNYLLYDFLLQKHPEKLTPYFRTSLELGRKLRGTDLVRDWIEVGKWRARMREFFEVYDILATPATAVPAFPPGSTGEVLGHGLIEWSFTPFTPVFNFTHHPVAAVPCGFSSDGLPIGLQVVGRLGEEATLLSLSRALEETIPWVDTYPPVS